jgi:hypothetical protein
MLRYLEVTGWRVRILVGLSVVLVGAAAPGAAVASGPGFMKTSSEAEQAAAVESGYARPPAPGTSAASLTSPSGCVQRADNPHHSHHQAGRVNAEVVAICQARVPQMTHTSQLWHTRFWGWDRIGKPGSFAGAGVKEGSAAANDVCHDGTFRVTGDGEIVDVDGLAYWASSRSRSTTDPCP